MTLNVLFPRIRPIRPERSVTWGDRPNKDRPFEKERTPVSLSPRARRAATFVYFSLLHRRRYLIRPDYRVIAVYPRRHAQSWTSGSVNPGHGPGARHDRVQWNAILLSPVSSLTHSCTWRRRDEELRKTFTFFVNNFQIVDFYNTVDAYVRECIYSSV